MEFIVKYTRSSGMTAIVEADTKEEAQTIIESQGVTDWEKVKGQINDPQIITITSVLTTQEV